MSFFHADGQNEWAPPTKGQDMTKTKPIHYWVYVGDKLVFDGPEDAAWAVASGLSGAKLHREPLPPTKGQDMKTPKMTFGDALEALKQGRRVARVGWNDKDTWLCLITETYVARAELPGLRRYFSKDVCCGPYIVMCAAQGVWQPGWLASQVDMLAEDWFVLPEDAP